MSWTSRCPRALLEESSPEERLTFDKWLEDNRKVCSIILASMTNEIQKQYDRLDDVPSIMLRMKESHGVKILSLVEKLEDLKAGLENDTCIDVILQSLPPSYDPFIVNYNTNGLDKSIHEIINMLVQYEATTHKSEPVVLVGKASTSKAKGKRVGRWKRKKGKGQAVAATASAGGAPAAPTERAKGRLGVQRSRANDVCMHWTLEEGVSTTPFRPSCIMVLERSRKLSKDEMILRLGNGKAVAAEAVGSPSLVISDHIPIILKEYFYIRIWHARLGYISKDRIRKLVDSKSLEVYLDHLPTYVCGPLNTPARGGFSYFITFTDDHSRYGYVYLIRYKLRPLEENGILSQCTPPGTPQFNGVAERRNQTLFDIVWSMMSFMKLPPSFLGYALETTAKCSWRKVFHRITDVMRYCLRNQAKVPQHDGTTSLEPPVLTDSIPILRRSTRESRVPERYGFVGLTSQLDNDPRTYGEAMSDIDSDKWLEAIKSEMD
ncbi:UNVERIFIED_CONTAM: hypothetical protein Slati_4558900 [Sesamum latifolium]|uniref:Retrovirus-related Pol polyprotein from transposon TNT 1-94 n=1 Tax=Sesamum latifolium TaxID=2727402 RepID=A0AAW2S2T1_9LAMI